MILMIIKIILENNAAEYNLKLTIRLGKLFKNYEAINI